MKLKKILISTLSAAAIVFGILTPAISTMAVESQLSYSEALSACNMPEEYAKPTTIQSYSYI